MKEINQIYPVNLDTIYMPRLLNYLITEGNNYYSQKFKIQLVIYIFSFNANNGANMNTQNNILKTWFMV